MTKAVRRGDTVATLSEADALSKMEYEVSVERSISTVFKMGDEFLIWGPASVEIVDKEQDKVSADALDKALPQLLKRARLSYKHTDQIVGKILDSFETESEIDMTIDGESYQRSEFPTDVIEHDDDPDALYVAGEVYADTEQAQDVRQKIENGDVDSYSISGEALVTEKQYDGTESFDEIVEMDLSAVTLCEEGMNQGAKFARIDGESVDLKSVSEPDVDADVSKSDATFSPAKGAVADPETAQQAINKTMTDSVDLDPDNVIKRDEIDGEVATKGFVEKSVSDAVDKQVANMFPSGDLATVSYVKQELLEREDHGDDEEHDDDEMKEDHDDDEQMEDYEDMEPDDMDMNDMDMEDYEDMETDDMDMEDYEDMETDDMDMDDDEMEDYEDKESSMDDGEGDAEDDEQMEGDSDMERGEGDLSREQLKEDLPDDVWKVVSEYVGDVKADVDKSDDDLAEDTNEGVANQISKQVEAVLSGDASPGLDPGLNQREDELEKNYDFADEDESESESDSPALSNFDYHN